MARKAAGAFLVLALALAGAASAHEIPSHVRVQAFLEPNGDRMRLLVRVPLAAMRDMSVPMDPLGYLDLTRVDSVLRDAAILWIADYVELYENGERLSRPEIVAARVSLPSDRSFDDYQSALAHVRGPPLPPETQIYWAQGLLDVLAPDVVLVADGGGVAQAVVNPVLGGKKVANLLRPFSSFAPGARFVPTLLNGAVGARIVGTDDGYDTAVSFVIEGGRISRIYAVRNPAKLARIDVEAPISR